MKTTASSANSAATAPSICGRTRITRLPSGVRAALRRRRRALAVAGRRQRDRRRLEVAAVPVRRGDLDARDDATERMERRRRELPLQVAQRRTVDDPETGD